MFFPFRVLFEDWAALCSSGSRTTNGVERLHREVRRRARVVSIFPNRASCLRLVSAVLSEISEERLTGRTYMTFEGSS